MIRFSHAANSWMVSSNAGWVPITAKQARIYYDGGYSIQHFHKISIT